MCWGVPGKIINIKGNIATVEISGVYKYTVLDLIQEPAIGDYVLVHAGYAIQKLDQDNAKFTLDFFKIAAGDD